MPFIKLWIHAVWSTKNRAPILLHGIRQNIFKHIKDYGALKNICVDTVNGHIDHVHCLISLKAKQDIATVLKLLKSECSHWAYKQKLFPCGLNWQDEYFAVSVSESGVDAVREYILNQEEHHKMKTFRKEYDEFIELYGFDPETNLRCLEQ